MLSEKLPKLLMLTNFSPAQDRTLIMGGISPVGGEVKATQVHLHRQKLPSNFKNLLICLVWSSQTPPGKDLLQSPSSR